MSAKCSPGELLCATRHVAPKTLIPSHEHPSLAAENRDANCSPHFVERAAKTIFTPIRSASLESIDWMCLGTARRGAGPLSKPSQGGFRPRVPAALRRPVSTFGDARVKVHSSAGRSRSAPSELGEVFLPRPRSHRPTGHALGRRPSRRPRSARRAPETSGTVPTHSLTGVARGGRLVHRGAAAGPPRGGLFLSSSLSLTPPGGAGALTAARAAALEERRGRRRRTGRSAAGWERERRAGAIGSPPRRGTPALRSPRWTWTTTTLTLSAAARAGFFFPRRAVLIRSALLVCIICPQCIRLQLSRIEEAHTAFRVCIDVDEICGVA